MIGGQYLHSRALKRDSILRELDREGYKLSRRQREVPVVRALAKHDEVSALPYIAKQTPIARRELGPGKISIAVYNDGRETGQISTTSARQRGDVTVSVDSAAYLVDL